MRLTFEQFETLVALESMAGNKDALERLSRVGNGTPAEVLASLLQQGLVCRKGAGRYALSDVGYRALEPYRVRRAVFMAAGFGSRMAPATLTTPKPLIVVNGKRIIDTLLDAVVAAGITEIYIVRGYRAEQFDVLLEKYPMIRFLENPLYDKANNIASGYVARDLYSKAYVLDSDLLLYNPSLIRKYEYRSNYLGVPVEKTDDWCFLAPNGVIEKIQIGGEKVYHWIGLSYWTAEDGARLATDIPEVLKQEGGSKYYWDEVALRVCKDRYRVHVRPIKADDLVEIDTYQELCALDSSYR